MSSKGHNNPPPSPESIDATARLDMASDALRAILLAAEVNLGDMSKAAEVLQIGIFKFLDDVALASDVQTAGSYAAILCDAITTRYVTPLTTATL